MICSSILNINYVFLKGCVYTYLKHFLIIKMMKQRNKTKAFISSERMNELLHKGL